MDLKDSTFVVTGGASGLGAATTRMLSHAGAHVVIADLRETEGNALAESLGKSVQFIRTDVCDETSAKTAVATALDTFGGVQGLVNCAGIVHAERIVGKEGPHSLSGFARAINITLIATFNLIGFVADMMTKAP